MAGEKTRFKKPDPLPELPEHRTPRIDEWCQDDESVKWWRDILETPQGLRLASIVRDARPGRSAGQSAEEALGEINGYDRLRRFLFGTLASPTRRLPSTKRPGEVPEHTPHPVATPP